MSASGVDCFCPLGLLGVERVPIGVVGKAAGVGEQRKVDFALLRRNLVVRDNVGLESFGSDEAVQYNVDDFRGGADAEDLPGDERLVPVQRMVALSFATAIILPYGGTRVTFLMPICPLPSTT
ncbi:MAG: hypothetical protein ACYDGY_06720 [Acidimicrobiales bacterium]